MRFVDCAHLVIVRHDCTFFSFNITYMYSHKSTITYLITAKDAQQTDALLLLGHIQCGRFVRRYERNMRGIDGIAGSRQIFEWKIVGYLEAGRKSVPYIQNKSVVIVFVQMRVYLLILVPFYHFVRVFFLVYGIGCFAYTVQTPINDRRNGCLCVGCTADELFQGSRPFLVNFL